MDREGKMQGGGRREEGGGGGRREEGEGEGEGRERYFVLGTLLNGFQVRSR